MSVLRPTPHDWAHEIAAARAEAAHRSGGAYAGARCAPASCALYDRKAHLSRRLSQSAQDQILCRTGFQILRDRRPCNRTSQTPNTSPVAPHGGFGPRPHGASPTQVSPEKWGSQVRRAWGVCAIIPGNSSTSASFGPRSGPLSTMLRGLSLEFPMHGSREWFRSQQGIPTVLQGKAARKIFPLANAGVPDPHALEKGYNR
jgi:hypothetical protein